MKFKGEAFGMSKMIMEITEEDTRRGDEHDQSTLYTNIKIAQWNNHAIHLIHTTKIKSMNIKA